MECFSLKNISLNSLLADRAWQQSLVICLCHLRSNTALLLACCCPISCPPNLLPERWAKNGEQRCKVNWEKILQSSKTIKGRTSISSSGLFFVLFEKQRKFNFLKSALSWMTHADTVGWARGLLLVMVPLAWPIYVHQSGAVGALTFTPTTCCWAGESKLLFIILWHCNNYSAVGLH